MKNAIKDFLSKAADYLHEKNTDNTSGDVLAQEEFIERRRAIKPTGSEKPPEHRKHIPLEESMVELNKACEESKKVREYFND